MNAATETKKTTRREVEEKLAVDQVVLRNGIFTVRNEYFYTHGRSEKDLVAEVLAAFPQARIIDSGNHWAAFRGGASTSQSSHWWVKFALSDCEISS